MRENGLERLNRLRVRERQWLAFGFEAVAKRGIRRRLGLVVPDFMTLPGLLAGSDLVATVPADKMPIPLRNKR